MSTEARVARTGTDTHREWARLGAAARLQQIDAERQSIFAAFPELRRERGRPAAVAGAEEPVRRGRGGSRKGRKLSPAARKRMSAGMRRYWARRKAGAQKSTQKASPKSA